MLTSRLNVGDDDPSAQDSHSSWGGISELRFGQYALCGVANFSSMDLGRLLETIKEAERQRVDPDPKMIASLDYVMDRINYWDEEKTRLYLDIEAEMPIAACDLSYSRPSRSAAGRIRRWRQDQPYTAVNYPNVTD